MARYMRTDLAAGHSRLGPPRVVGAGLVNPPIQGQLFPVADTQLRITRRRAQSRLEPPVVVTPIAAFIASPVETKLAYSRRGRPGSYLGRPVVVFDTIRFFGPAVHLPLSRRGAPKSSLKPPAVVSSGQVFYLSVNLTPHDAIWRRTNQRMVQFVLRKPTDVVDEQDKGHVGVHLSYSYTTRRAAHAKLQRPVVVAVAVVSYGPATHLAHTDRRYIKTRSTYIYPFVLGGVQLVPRLSITLVRSPKPSTIWMLGVPVVVDQAVIQIYYGPQVHLTKLRPPKTESRLFAPAVVGEGVVFQPLQGSLFPFFRLPLPYSRLHPPVVVTQVVVQTFYGPSVTFAPSLRGRPLSALRKPVVIDNSPQAVYLTVWLAYSRRGAPKPRLQPPTVVDVRIYSGPAVALSNSRRGVAKSVLRPPTVIDLRPQAYYLSTTLAYSRRGTPKSRLKPPTVIDTRVYIGPSVMLAYSVRGIPKSELRPPAVIDVKPQTYYLSVTLVRSLRGAPKSTLRPPQVITRDAFFGPSVVLTYSRRGRARAGLAAPMVVFMPEPVLHPVAVTLAYSVRGKPKSFLRRPLVVGAVVYYGPFVNLAYSRRGVPKSKLGAPAVIDTRPQTYYLTVWLAYSLRGRPLSRLEPPVVVDRTVFFGPVVQLTYSRRGAPKSTLRVPVVIDLRPQTYFVSVNLTYSSRRRGVAELRAPAVISRDVFFTNVHLTYSRRGRPKSILRKPIVIDLRPQVYYLNVALAYSVRKRGRALLKTPTRVFAFIARPIDITLAPQTRGKTRRFLEPPTVVRSFIARPVLVELSYSRRGRPVYELRAPTVVGPVLARHIAITFAYSRRGQPKPFLNPPTRVFAFTARAINVTLAPQSRGRTHSLLVPPAVVREFVAPALQVNLTPSQTRPANYGLAAPAVVGIPEPVLHPIAVTLAYSLRGRPIYFATGITLTVFVPDRGDVCGDDEAGSLVEGMSSSGSTICGDDDTLGTVSGSDSENT